MHQGFGVRSGHQHASINVQVQAEKLFAAHDIGQGLATGAAQAVGAVARGDGFAQHVVIVGQQPGPFLLRFAQRVQEQQLRIQSLQAQCLSGGKGLGASDLVGGVHTIRYKNNS